ncbi:MAG: MMPL family transporter [Pseudomonadota bacterium]
MINGFGLERIGLAALRLPLVSSLVIALVTLVALVGVLRLEFSGENIEILRDGSVELEHYDELLQSFRNFNNDAVVLMRIPNLATVEGIETFRELNFEFQLDDRVESILSIFSLVRYASPELGWQSALPAEFQTDDEVKAALKALAAEIPSSQSLFSPNYDSAVMVVYTKAEATADNQVQETMRGLTELAKDFETDSISISIAGQPAIRADIIHSIVSDIQILAPIAVLMCALLSLILFRHPVAMIICALPALISVLWFLGGAGLLGIKLNFLTNILPVLLIVVIFADTLHLYLKWQNNSDSDATPIGSISSTIKQVGPACALSTLTTAVALLSLCISGNFGLLELGLVGAVAIITGYVCLMLVLPTSLYWANRSGFAPKQARARRLSLVAVPAIAVLKYKKTLIGIGFVLCAVGLYAHLKIDNRFRLIDYLGSQSEVGQSEVYIDKTYSGTTPLFAIVDMDASIKLDAPENEKRVYDTTFAASKVFGEGSYYSLADFAEELKKGGGKLDDRLLDEIPRELTSRFVSINKDKMLVTIFSSSNLSASEMQSKIGQFRTELANSGLEDVVRITGYPILSGVVAPRLMDNLRISLLVAVILSIFMIAIAARSMRLGLYCLIPNLLPILSVELILFFAGIPLNMSITVALTVAFGIAVDDSIHMINQYMINKERHDNLTAVAGALKEVTPAIFSTTLILSAGLLIMCFSSLPAMAVFSMFVILTLVFAFLADIFQLPAYLALNLDKAKVE